jgi:predicted GNAT family N-acyltransferase
LAGVVVVRDGTHLFHLFVAESFQGRGWARQLWQHALFHIATGTTPDVTVNATLRAQGFYERMGFVASGPAVETRGVAFVPMRRPGDASGSALWQTT